MPIKSTSPNMQATAINVSKHMNLFLDENRVEKS